MIRRADAGISFAGFPRLLWGIVIFLGLFGALSPNPALTIASAALMGLFILLVSRPGEPPVLLLALGFQWLQATMQVHHANFLGLDVRNLLMDYGGDSEMASWLSMAALAVLAIGMATTAPRRRGSDVARARQDVELFSVDSLWKLYLAALVGSAGILSVAWIVPGLTQPALAMAGMKWAVFFALAYICLSRNEKMHLLVTAFFLEFVLALGGYFAEFKTVFFVTLLALITAGTRLSSRQALLAGVLVAVLLLCSVIWSTVKVEYRNYLSGGTSAQIVVPDYVDRTEKLAELVSEMTLADLAQGLESLAQRVSYVQFFARVLDHVPASVPHEDGEILMQAVSHVFAPRLFFPDKPPLRDDSEETGFYTGLMIAGQEEGTSVSLGYVAQMYIDFGEYWMFVPIFLLGCLWGLLYRFFLTREHIPLTFRYGLCVAVMLDVMRFETTLIKLLGGTITAFLVAYVIQRFMLPPLIPKVTRNRIVVRTSAIGQRG